MNKKNNLGQFYTPEPIAELMVKWVLENNAETLLDPAVGQGVFLQEAYKLNQNLELTAYEIDGETIDVLKQKCFFPFNLYNYDYLTSITDKKYSAIVCNPPYNRFQNIPERDKYISLFNQQYNFKLSGYSNLYIYFLIKSINELEIGGRCCFIVPYEFLSTGYGEIVKKYLIDKKILKHIIKFNSDLKIFDDAMTTSCILCFENRENDYVNFINISDIKQLSAPFNENVNAVFVEDIDYKEKWLKYFKNDSLTIDLSKLVNLSSVAKVKRGIATGNNNYFSLNKKKIQEFGLSQNVCMPCITKSQDIKSFIFTDKLFCDLVNKEKNVFIFEGEKAKTNSDYLYIDYGVKCGVNKSYLNSHRQPWFSIENKDIAPILISVFSRGKLKIVRNEAKVKNLTTFHGLYFLKNESNDFINILFCYLITPIAQDILRLNKREYGDGLDKFEPNDLNNALILDLSILSQEDKAIILGLYKKLKVTDNKIYIEKLNAIFKNYICK